MIEPPDTTGVPPVLTIDGEIDIGVPMIRVVSGREICLRCNATGTPTPSIEYRRNGNRVNIADPRLRILANGNLCIRVDVVIVGMYDCVATNIGGTDSARTNVQFIGKYCYHSTITCSSHDVHMMFTCIEPPRI